MDSDHQVCRECGAKLAAGYLCDCCDTVEVLEK